MSRPVGIDRTAGFLSATGVTVHRTGAVTDDQAWLREVQLQAIRVLAAHDAMDLLEMLFKPSPPIEYYPGGQRKGKGKLGRPKGAV